VQLFNQHKWNGCQGVIGDLPATLVAAGVAMQHGTLSAAVDG